MPLARYRCIWTVSYTNLDVYKRQEQMSGERAQLLSKQEQARSRVEAMIGRLKSLEQHT